PGAFAVLSAKTGFPAGVVPRQPAWTEAMADFRSRGAVLLALLLFFQFGNEWSIAGWLPIFLIHRLGMSPQAALKLLAIYWLALLIGRVAAIAILRRGAQGRGLLRGAAAAHLGCALLRLSADQVVAD